MIHYRVIRVLVTAVVSLAVAKPTTDDSVDAVERKNARDILKRIDAEYGKWSNKYSLAEWNYASNLTDENLAEKLNVSAATARVRKQIAEEVNAFPWRDLKNENIKRQFSKFGILGVAALPEDVRIKAVDIRIMRRNLNQLSLIANYIYENFL